MTVLASILLFALTRAEIIERMKAPPIMKVGGLVEVVAACPADLRREFQMPIATYVSNICTMLYRGLGEKPARFEEPGIVIYLGEVRTNRTDVIVRGGVRDDGAKYTRLTLPAPAYTDLVRLRRETVKAFYLAVKGRTLGDAEADRVFRDADPELKIDDEYRALALWRRGVYGKDTDDEHYLRLARSILQPGVARKADVLRFASRLYFYPEVHSSPFCGKYSSCSFREAITLAKRDARIRFLAYMKCPQVIAYGGGRGEDLLAAATAYSVFLRELAVYTKSEEELGRLLDEADAKLNAAMEAAAEFEKGRSK